MSKQSKVVIREAEPGEASLLSTIAYDAKGFCNYPEELMKLWKNDLAVTSDFIAANMVRYAATASSVLGLYTLFESDSHF